VRLIPSLLLAVLFSLCAGAQTKLIVNVTDAYGAPLTDLSAANFSVMEKTPKTVIKAEYKRDAVDVLLMVEASAFTNSYREDIERVAGFLITELGPKEQMAVLAYSDSAELLQDFTSSKQSLSRAIKGLRFGNNASLYDSLFAALDTGFQNAVARKILIVISGPESGPARVKRPELVDLAERRGVSIIGISLAGRSPVDDLTKETAGIQLSGRELKPVDQAAKNVFAAARGHYELTVDGSELAGRLKVDVKPGKEKMQVTYRRD
jgi:hypothetical protein